jgi:hypothetical protein
MKNGLPPNIEKLRITTGPMASDLSYGMNGAFEIPYASDVLYVVISNGAGWDHASVSLRHRCPTWDEMHWIKNIFFEKEETVIQFHPPESEYVNNHSNCLHLWRHQNIEVIRPPGFLVGI